MAKYTIRTSDGIIIRDIPDDVKPDSQEIKDRVAQLRAGRQSTEQRAPTPEEQRDAAIRSGELPAIGGDRERLGMAPRQNEFEQTATRRRAQQRGQDTYRQ